MDDADAVGLALAGDREGAAYLLEKYQMDVYNLSLRIVGNTADAEDVAQETFLTAFQRLGTYRRDEPFGPWVRGIARNRSIDAVRRRARVAVPEPPRSENVEQVALDRIEAARVREALDRLPPRDRTLLVLRYWEDQPAEAIARSLGMTEGAVRVALLRARKALGGILAAEESGVEV